MASKRLKIATGGSKDYTFTLLNDQFDSNDIFYQKLSDLLAKDHKIIDAKLLKKFFEFNQKIERVLSPLYNHATKLFAQHFPHSSFSQYEHCLMTGDHFWNDRHRIESSIEGRKIKALLTTYIDLIAVASAHIDFLHRGLITPTKKEDISRIITNALESPELLPENDFITKIIRVTIDVVSIACARIPFLSNYFLMSQTFFSHKTVETQKLLHHVKDEVSTCMLDLNQ